MSTETASAKLDIKLSDRAPVRISTDEWPVIAEARRLNAWVRVRRHVFGRVLVHGERSGRADRVMSAGFLLEGRESYRLPPVGSWLDARHKALGKPQLREVSSDEVARAIRRVVGVLGRDVEIIAAEAIGNLPPEEL